MSFNDNTIRSAWLPDYQDKTFQIREFCQKDGLTNCD